MTPLLRLGCGACAGIIGMSATYPLDMVRGRLTVQNNKEYTGIMHATRQIIKQVCAAAAAPALLAQATLVATSQRPSSCMLKVLPSWMI